MDAKQRYFIVDNEKDFSIVDTHTTDLIRIPYSAIEYLILELEKRKSLVLD